MPNRVSVYTAFTTSCASAGGAVHGAELPADRAAGAVLDHGDRAALRHLRGHLLPSPQQVRSTLVISCQTTRTCESARAILKIPH